MMLHDTQLFSACRALKVPELYMTMLLPSPGKDHLNRSDQLIIITGRDRLQGVVEHWRVSLSYLGSVQSAKVSLTEVKYKVPPRVGAWARPCANSGQLVRTYSYRCTIITAIEGFTSNFIGQAPRRTNKDTVTETKVYFGQFHELYLKDSEPKVPSSIHPSSFEAVRSELMTWRIVNMGSNTTMLKSDSGTWGTDSVRNKIPRIYHNWKIYLECNPPPTAWGRTYLVTILTS